MWCPNCQHGHEPDENGMCPCTDCFYQLVVIEENVIKVEAPVVVEEVKEVVEEVKSEAVAPKPKKRGRPKKKVD